MQVMFSTDGYAFPETFYLGWLIFTITLNINIILKCFVVVLKYLTLFVPKYMQFPLLLIYSQEPDS